MRLTSECSILFEFVWWNTDNELDRLLSVMSSHGGNEAEIADIIEKALRKVDVADAKVDGMKPSPL
jgi:hypothetical protein